MSKIIDLTGQRFGRLTVIKRNGIDKNGHTIWECKCDCGNTINVLRTNLIRNRTKSCGCYNKELVSKRTKKYNTYNLSGDYGIGYTSKGKEFYFDLEDYELIKNYCWYIDSNGYVKANKYNSINKSSDIIQMHILVLNNNNGYIDHIHHNKNDNRKSELRIVTNQENAMNACIKSNNTSGVTGVTYNKQRSKWVAQIMIDGRGKNLGYYHNFKDTVTARKQAEKKYFGEYSYDNSMNK